MNIRGSQQVYLAFCNSAIKCSVVGSALVGGVAYKTQSKVSRITDIISLRRARVVIQRCYGVSAPIIDGKTAEGGLEHLLNLGTSAPSFAIEERTQQQLSNMKGQRKSVSGGTACTQGATAVATAATRAFFLP